MRYLNTPIIYEQSFEGIDAEKGVIMGVKVTSEGEAKGHGVWLDKEFVRDTVRFGKEMTAGVKARFGHPTMCSEALGTYIGRYKNFRTQREELSGSKFRYHAIADLHLDDVADKSPKGKLKEYVLEMANSNPDMFGSSIVFTQGEIKQKEIKTDDDEKIVRDYATIEKLHATDVVDEPAATDGLFSSVHEDDLAFEVTRFLDGHPEVYTAVHKNPELLQHFMDNYNEYKSKQDNSNENIMTTLKSFMKSFKEEMTTFFTGLVTKAGNSDNKEELTNAMNELKEKFEAEAEAIVAKYDEETPSEETPTEETPAEEVPAEETPAEEAPAEENPEEEVPAEETPAEETPAEELSDEQKEIKKLNAEVAEAKKKLAKFEGKETDVEETDDPNAPDSGDSKTGNALSQEKNAEELRTS